MPLSVESDIRRGCCVLLKLTSKTSSCVHNPFRARWQGPGASAEVVGEYWYPVRRCLTPRHATHRLLGMSYRFALQSGTTHEDECSQNAQTDLQRSQGVRRPHCLLFSLIVVDPSSPRRFACSRASGSPAGAASTGTAGRATSPTNGATSPSTRKVDRTAPPARSASRCSGCPRTSATASRCTMTGMSTPSKNCSRTLHRRYLERPTLVGSHRPLVSGSQDPSVGRLTSGDATNAASRLRFRTVQGLRSGRRKTKPLATIGTRPSGLLGIRPRNGSLLLYNGLPAGELPDPQPAGRPGHLGTTRRRPHLRPRQSLRLVRHQVLNWTVAALLRIARRNVAVIVDHDRGRFL